MKKLILLASLMVSSAVFAQTVSILNTPLGSGTPGNPGKNAYETALPSGDGYLHVPQYLAAFPTAATIWPRVVEVPCTKADDAIKCQGYMWTPKMGRGEYLFIKPTFAEPVAPVAPIIITVKEIVQVPYPIFVEVAKNHQ